MTVPVATNKKSEMVHNSVVRLRLPMDIVDKASGPRRQADAIHQVMHTMHDLINLLFWRRRPVAQRMQPQEDGLLFNYYALDVRSRSRLHMFYRFV